MAAGLELSLTALKLIVMGMTLYLRRSVRVLSDVQYLFCGVFVGRFVVLAEFRFRTECYAVAALSADQDVAVFAECIPQEPVVAVVVFAVRAELQVIHLFGYFAL